MSSLAKKSIEDEFPNLVKEWDYNKNYPLVPKDITRGSHKKLFWECSLGHSWEAIINNRVKGHRCPYCAGKRLLKEKSLFYNRPHLEKEWDYEKNGNINPEETFEFSNTKVWWKCGKGHSFLQNISKRTMRGTGCPYCAGYLPTKENCLLTKYPELCNEWDYQENKIKPDGITAHSAKRVFWKCKYGHKWNSRLDSRVRGNTDCPYCDKIELNDGEFCDSKAEAIKYIEFKEKKLNFYHNKSYGGKMWRSKYDFYFPDENKYVEVTSYTKENLKHKNGRYIKYLRKIARKRKFVKGVLGANFEFLQFVPTPEQMEKVRANIVGDVGKRIQ